MLEELNSKLSNKKKKNKIVDKETIYGLYYYEKLNNLTAKNFK